MIQPAQELTTRSPSAPGKAEVSDASDPAIDAKDFAVEAARLVSDLRCEDVVIFDVRGLSPVTQYIVIASGTSDRQIKSVGGDVADLGEQHGFPRYGADRDGGSTWMVVDLVEVMVHLFEPATRGHYDLEMMWGDAPRVKWRRPGQASEGGRSDAEPSDDASSEAESSENKSSDTESETGSAD